MNRNINRTQKQHETRFNNMQQLQINKMNMPQKLSFSLFQEYVDFIDRPGKTERTYLVNLRQFAAWLLYSNITQPQRKDIVLYRQYLSTEHKAIKLDAIAGWKYRTDKQGNHIFITCKPNTVKQYLQSVCAFFRWTSAEGYYPNIAENIHAPKIQQDIHKKDALTAADVLKIEQSIKESMKHNICNAATQRKDTQGKINRATEQGKRLFAMYLLAVNCGLRTIEIHRANIKDLAVKDNTAYLYIHGKGHTEADARKILAPGVYDAIQDYLSSRTDAYNSNSPLFVSTGNRSRGKRIATTTISTMLKRAMQQGGYNSERLTAHSLRHTAGTAAMMLTNDIYLTQKYMRHSNPGTTEIYLHNNTDKQESKLAIDLFNYYHAAGAEKQQEIFSN
jgi:integrase/recombinase XerC